MISVSDSTGASLGINAYDEYGMPAAGNLGRYGYAGQAWIGPAKLWHLNARAYSPALGRFLQTDPIGYAGDGPNLYAYVLNDPVNFVDPLGLADIIVTGHRICWECKIQGQILQSWILWNQLFPGAAIAAAAAAAAAAVNEAQSKNNCPRPARLSSLDGFIGLATIAYNFGRGFGAPAAEALPADLIQAMVAVESGYNASAYASDPMQVNKPGDWDPRKAQYGLTQGVAPGQYLGIAAGIQWLIYKAYRYDSTGARVSFRGWGEAITRYNGGGDPKYLSKVQAARARIRQGC